MGNVMDARLTDAGVVSMLATRTPGRGWHVAVKVKRPEPLSASGFGSSFEEALGDALAHVGAPGHARVQL